MVNDILNIENIKVEYDNEPVFQDLSFTIKKGDKIAVTGDSGKGKTSLINALLGFVPITQGKITWFGKKLNKENLMDIRKEISWLPQETALYFESVKEMIYTPFSFKNNKANIPTEKEIFKIFKIFNLPEDILNKNIDEISGGQKQRLLLTGIFLLHKPVMILDEPTSSVDENNKKIITDFILSKKELTLIAISHDPYWIELSQKIIAL